MEKIIYEYCIIRYVPDVERQEFINIGLMMMCKRFRWMRCEIVIDESRIAHLLSWSNHSTAPTHDPRISNAIDRLRIQSALFTRTDVPTPGLPVEERYRWLAAVKSAILQTSPSHPGLLLHSSSGSRPTPDLTRADAIHLLDAKFTELLRRLIL